MVATVGSGPGLKTGVENSIQFFYMSAGAQRLQPSSPAFSRALAGSI